MGPGTPNHGVGNDFDCAIAFLADSAMGELVWDDVSCEYYLKSQQNLGYPLHNDNNHSNLKLLFGLIFHGKPVPRETIPNDVMAPLCQRDMENTQTTPRTTPWWTTATSTW